MTSSSEIRYNQILQRIVNSVKKDIDGQLLPAVLTLQSDYVRDSWGADIQDVIDALLVKWTSGPFKRLANRLSSSFIRTTLRTIDREQKRTFGIDALQESTRLREIMRAAAIQNAYLIQSIPEQYLKTVGQSVLSTMRTGLLPRAVAEHIESEYGVTQRRARFIARDQTAKINGELAERRQQDAGYEFFGWMTSHDERVRHSHDEVAKADVGYGPGIYRWDNPPKNERGETIKPGSDYQCRCWAKPIRNSIVRRYQESKAA